MKRTLKNTLGAFALALAGIGGLSIASPAQAAYIVPYVPAGCSQVSTASYPYPYQLSTAPTTTGWYVYCGANVTRFQTRAGDLLKNLPTAAPSLRQRFQDNNYTLYVFTTAAQAQTLMGSAAFPAATQANGILGVHQPEPIGNSTTRFVAIFEQPKDATGTPVEYPFTNLMYNFDEALYHETGHAIDKLATTAGSGSTAANTFHPRITADISAFNAINGCATSGPNLNFWNTNGSHKTTICDGAGNKRTTPVNYAAKTNLQILREFHTETSWTQYFQNTPTYNEIWAQLIAISRGGTGPAFVETDAWMQKLYICGKLYTNQLYSYWTVPSISCP